MRRTLPPTMLVLMICLTLAALLPAPPASLAIATSRPSAGRLSPCSITEPPPPPPPPGLGAAPALLGAAGSRPQDGQTTWAPPALLKDVNPAIGDTSSNPNAFVTVGNYTFFTALDTSRSIALWRTDGTSAGTIKIKGIAYDGLVSAINDPLVVKDSLVYFFVHQERQNSELWRTDGTLGGTTRVAGGFYLHCGAFPGQLARFKDGFFFAADDTVSGHELWFSDGTPQGTALFKDLVPGPDSAYINDLIAVDDDLFFTTMITDVVQLWHSDGTIGGTRPIKSLTRDEGNYGMFRYQPVRSFNGKFIFSINTPEHGLEPWISDGTPEGTLLLKDIAPGAQGSYPLSLTAFGDRLYFNAFDPVHGGELWSTQGTSATTALVADINPGAEGSYPDDFTVFGSRLVFSANSADGRELWSSDGTAAGTTLLKDLREGSGSGSPRHFTRFGSALMFIASIAGSQTMLWRTDGTAAGTQPIAPVCTLTNCGHYASPGTKVAALGNQLVLSGGDPAHGMELWRSDGTSANTKMLNNISQTGEASSPQMLTAVDDGLFFTAASQKAGPRELWYSDGSATTPITGVAEPSGLTSHAGKLVFAATDAAAGRELWRSDGTVAGTHRIKDIRPGDQDGMVDSPTILSVKGAAFFAADDGVSGEELWKSDGTITGTVRVRDINPGAESAQISQLTAVSGTLFFTADDGVAGRELWRSDGTITGTIQVNDLTPGPASSQLGALAAADDELLFTRYLSSTAELWRSDGTAAGTSLLMETPSSWMFPFTVADGGLYFFTRVANNPVKLWHMADSRATPVMLKEFPFPAIYNEVKVAVHAGKFFFTVREPEARTYLWKSDGTVAGTGPVVGQGGQPLSWWSIDTLKSIGDSLFMRADDGKYGHELWIYQSEPDRAYLWSDIAAEGAGSFPDHVTVVGDRIFFTADDAAHGREIWHSAPQVIPPTYRVYLTMLRR